MRHRPFFVTTLAATLALVGCGKPNIAGKQIELIAELNADATGATYADLSAYKNGHFTLENGQLTFSYSSCFSPVALQDAGKDLCDAAAAWSENSDTLTLGSLDRSSIRIASPKKKSTRGYAVTFNTSCAPGKCKPGEMLVQVLPCRDPRTCKRMARSLIALDKLMASAAKQNDRAIASSTASASQPTDPLDRVRADIADGAAMDGPTLTWNSIRVETPGRFAITLNRCDINGSPSRANIAKCRAAPPSALRSNSFFDAIAVDPKSIRVSDTEHVSFSCRHGFICGIEVLPSVASNSGVAVERGEFICAGRAACQRLAADFGALVAAQSKEDAFLARASDNQQQILSAINAINDRLRSAIWQENDEVYWEPSFGLSQGLGLSFIEADCSNDDVDFDSDAPAGNELVSMCRRAEGNITLQNKTGILIDHYPTRLDLTALDGAALSIVKANASKGESGTALKITCKTGSGCARNALNGQTKDSFELFCTDEASCTDLYKDLGKLFSVLSAAQTPAELAAQFHGTHSALDAPLERVNADIDRAVWFEGSGALVTTRVTRDGNGALRISGHRCPLTQQSSQQEIDACRTEEPEGTDTALLFKGSDVDASSISIDSGAGGKRLIFYCKGKGACVMRPDRSRYLPGAYLACPDDATCDRLVLDFTSLLDRAAQQDQ